MKQVPVHTTNFYTDELEFFNAEYMTDLNKHRLKTQHSLLSSLPFVDFRAIDNSLKEAYASKDSEPQIDLFPRWVAMTSIYNQDRTKMTSSFMIAGDSKLERNLGVAPGFSNRILKQDELITTNDIMTVLGVSEDETISADFDLLQILGG